MLLSLLVAVAVVGIMLARTLPRDAMRAQRIREEKLVSRGEQYSRAIEIYFREHKKYPESLDDLEDTNGVRYLRRRYKDPITGEDEWRLIHMGSDGRFKDSLIYDATEDDPTREDGGRSRFGSSDRERVLKQVASAPDPGGFAGADRARAVRQSAAPENPLEQSNAAGSALGVAGGVAPADPNAPPQIGPDGRPIQPDYSQMRPGQIPPNAGQAPAPGQAPFPGAFPPAAAGQPGQDPYGQAAPPGGFGRQGPTRASRFGQTAATAQAALAAGGGSSPTVNPDAAQMLQRLLTTPRPGGLRGLQGQAAAQQQAGQAVFPEGVAGVASKSKQTGVKVYHGREQYNEWEFVYDYRSDGMEGPGGPEQAAGGADAPTELNPNQPGLNPAGGFAAPPGAYPAVAQPGQAWPQPGVTPPAPTPGSGPYPPSTAPAAGAPVPDGVNPGDPGVYPPQPDQGTWSPYPTPDDAAEGAYPTEPPNEGAYPTYPVQPGNEGAYPIPIPPGAGGAYPNMPTAPGNQMPYPTFPPAPGMEGLYPTAPEQGPQNRRGRQLPRSRFGDPLYPNAPEQNAPPSNQQ